MTGDKNWKVDFKRRLVIAGTLVAAAGVSAPMNALAASSHSATVGKSRLDLDRFVADCIEANRESDAQAAVEEVLARAVSTPESLIQALGEPKKAGMNVLLSSPALTIFAATWTPQMNLMPHDHLMWANIGIYTGREDNIFWNKTTEGIEAYGADALFVKDTAMLPVDALHSVTNPLQRFTGGMHIYGGDFFNTTRSQWDPETLAQEPSDGARIRAMFDRENERLGLDTS